MNEYQDYTAGNTSSDVKKLKEKTSSVRKKGQPTRRGIQIFSFDSLHEVSKFAVIVSKKFNGENTLYKDEAKGQYYLILHQGDLEDNLFKNICSLLTEYGTAKFGSNAEEQYLSEHYSVVLKNNAVQTLSAIQ